ncbi:MAG: hypothetical protein VW268_14240 [Rhodospirillaceae bacterium]
MRRRFPDIVSHGPSYGRSDGLRSWAAVGLAAAVLVGCSLAQPYVHHDSDFDRDHPEFAKDNVVRSTVVVCYSKSATTPEKVAALGRAACAKMGRTAEFDTTVYTLCPMVTPVAAVFRCNEATGGAQPSGAVDRAWPDAAGAAGAADTRGQLGPPMAGFSDGARPLGALFGRPAP